MRSSITTRKHKNIYRLLAAAFWLGVWQLAAMLVGQEILLASPLAAAGRFLELTATAVFWRAAAFSLARIFGGFLLGLAAGVLFAALAARFEAVRILLSPIYSVLRAIPVASFVIVALIWVPSASLSVLISFLIVFPILYASTLSEIERTDPDMLEMARVFRLSRGKKLLYVYALPAAKGFEAACATAIGLAWKSGVAAELISIPSGSIGEKLYMAKVYLMTGDLFAWTAAIVLLSAACAGLFKFLLRTLAAAAERM